MVASKTSFVIAAVALGAATSVYAAPVQYSDGADLAARGFEDEYSQLAARFFDDELEARDFDDELEARDFDEEEYLFARGFPSAANNSPSPIPSHASTQHSDLVQGGVNGYPKDRVSPFPAHSTSSSGSPPGVNGHRVFAANHGSPSKDADDYKDHHKYHHKDGQQQHKDGQQQHKPAGLTGSGSPHPVSGFNRLASGSKDHSKSEKMTIFAANHKNDGTVQTPGKNAQSPSLKQRDFEEGDAILLARSLGLDDDFFLEARSFDDDMYEYY